MIAECERCHRHPRQYEPALFDYCAQCSKNLCAECMAKGCCGSTPAESGEGRDAVDEAESREDT